MSEQSSDDRQRVLEFYIQQCNDLGARVLRLQEEQSRAHRESRRSRTTAKMVREAYGLVDINATTEVVGKRILDIVIENALCDRSAILKFDAEHQIFTVQYMLGSSDRRKPRPMPLVNPPSFYFTTSKTDDVSPATELRAMLGVPYILWAFDPASGYALILGNQSEANVARPFEPDDRQLVEGALNVFTDIVQRARTEADLRKARIAVEEASATKLSFLANLSHELRTPLNAVIGFAEMLRDETFGPLGSSKYKQYADGIYSSGNHLLSLINDILDFSRLEAGKDPLHEEIMDLRHAAIAALTTVETAARTKDIAISIDIEEDAPLLLADARRVRQILINLMANSVKFTQAGGQISVAAQIEADGGLLLSVSDNGIGIAPDDIPTALEPFGQVGSIYTRDQPGAGLGLPLCKALIERHEGSLFIQSELGRGTVINVRFPKRRVRWRNAARKTRSR